MVRKDVLTEHDDIREVEKRRVVVGEEERAAGSKYTVQNATTAEDQSYLV